MKKHFKFLTFIIFISFFASFHVLAQGKFAHVNTDELLKKMPGRSEAEIELREYTQYLEQQFASMQNEFQQKYQEFLENESEYSQLIRQSKERELTNLQHRIVEFQETAQQDLMEKEEQLLRPLINNARKAIEAVAKEHNYTYVFDMSGGSLVYADPGDDITHLVKQELGIEE